MTSPRILNQTWTYSNFLTNGYDRTKPYEIAFNDYGGSYGGYNYPVYGCGIQGYSKPVSPDFSRGCF